MSDVEISSNCFKKKILDIAKDIGVDEEDLELYGNYKAKINLNVLRKYQKRKDGKLILVTAINPTKVGEGKTTTTIALGQAFARINKKAILALR